jgi:hypothetical protein
MAARCGPKIIKMAKVQHLRLVCQYCRARKQSEGYAKG